MSFSSFLRKNFSDLIETRYCLQCAQVNRVPWCESKFCLDCCRKHHHGCEPAKPSGSTGLTSIDNRRWKFDFDINITNNFYNDNRQMHVHNYPPSLPPQQQYALPEEQYYLPEPQPRRLAQPQQRPQPRHQANYYQDEEPDYVPPRRARYVADYDDVEPQPPQPTRRMAQPLRRALPPRRSEDEVFAAELIRQTGNNYTIEEVLADADLFRALTLEAARRR